MSSLYLHLFSHIMLLFLFFCWIYFSLTSGVPSSNIRRLLIFHSPSSFLHSSSNHSLYLLLFINTSLSFLAPIFLQYFYLLVSYLALPYVFSHNYFALYSCSKYGYFVFLGITFIGFYILIWLICTHTFKWSESASGPLYVILVIHFACLFRLEMVNLVCDFIVRWFPLTLMCFFLLKIYAFNNHALLLRKIYYEVLIYKLPHYLFLHSHFSAPISPKVIMSKNLQGSSNFISDNNENTYSQ